MNFDELDRRLRVFETAHDHCALPGLYLVARLDGRGFTHLPRERRHFAAPFDERFRDLMTATVRHLMDCGFRVGYGYTQSDEISLLSHPDEDAFGCKLRKWLSILAGEASACFALNLGEMACFDCRVSQPWKRLRGFSFPTLERGSQCGCKMRIAAQKLSEVLLASKRFIIRCQIAITPGNLHGYPDPHPSR